MYIYIAAARVPTRAAAPTRRGDPVDWRDARMPARPRLGWLSRFPVKPPEVAGKLFKVRLKSTMNLD